MSTNRYFNTNITRDIVELSYLDPLAQSFIIDTNSILTKLDLFFSAKDSVLPTKIEIRKVLNGVPSDIILNNSEINIPAANILISSNSLVATTVNFSGPVVTEIGEYALCFSTESNKTKLWVSQVGEVDVSTNQVVQKQTNLGVLYKSKNSSVWVPELSQDIKFNLYRARFSTNTTATVDFTLGNVTSTLTKLPYDPFEVYPNSNLMRVYHPNHGFKNQSYTLLPELHRSNLISNVKYFGIDSNSISGYRQIVSNVTTDSYTIELPISVDNTVTDITRFGKNLFGFSDFRFSEYHSSVFVIKNEDSSVRHQIKLTNTDYQLDSSFTNITYSQDNILDEVKTIPNSINREVFMQNASPVVYRVEFFTGSPYSSPVLNLDKAGIVFINNKINNPTYETEHKVPGEIKTITTGNTISFTFISNTIGQINLSNSNARANAVTMVKGTKIRITGSNNTSNVRVLDVLNSGANVLVFGSIVNENNTDPNANIVLYNGTKFIAEEAATNGSALSKYITRPLNFINPSTAFKFFIDVNKPKDTYIKFYYRVSVIGDTSTIKEKEYTEVTDIVIRDSLGNEFFEIEKLVENISSFDGLQFKIVFLSDNSSKVPRCRNLRIVAIA